MRNGVWAVFYPIPPYRGLACLFATEALAKEYASNFDGYTVESWGVQETSDDLADLIEDWKQEQRKKGVSHDARAL